MKSKRMRHWIVPLARNPKFVGRQDEIVKLEGLITRQHGPRRIAVTGLGGVGKTQVALELAYRIRDRDKECSIFWIPCTSHAMIEQGFLHIAQKHGLHDVKPTEVKEQVKIYLSSERAGKWLLVLDNADDAEMWFANSYAAPPLEDFLPESGQGHILFTTRNQKLAMKLAPFNVVSIPDVDKETAVGILDNTLEREDLQRDTITAAALLEQLAFLPLAIIQASAYIIQNEINLSTYLALLQEREQDAVDLLSEDFRDPGHYNDIQNPVITTWLISFQQIQRQDPLAADYLSFIACIDPRNIPQSLLPQPASRKQEIDALGLLNAYSFTNSQGGYINMHRLVHIATRNWLRKNALYSHWIQQVAEHMQKVFPNDHYMNRGIWQEYLPHAIALVHENEFVIQEEKYLGLTENIADCLDSDGRYQEAELFYKKLMRINQKKAGPQDFSTLNIMSMLALNYGNQNRWNEAGKLLMQVMETLKIVQGAEHPDTLFMMNNLALTYLHQHRGNEAEKLFIQVIETSKVVLGAEHSQTLISINSLASTYLDQGRLNEAEKLFMQVMETSKTVQGAEHPDTLLMMNNLAFTYMNQGRWNEAEKLFMQVMETSKTVLGAEHLKTLISIGNLASTYRKQGRYDEAEMLEIQVIETKKTVLGAEHQETLISMAILASTYGDQGRWNEAEKLFMQVMETSKTVQGAEHPDTLLMMNNLAFTYMNQGRWNEAEKLHVQVLEAKKRVLGPEHLSTLNSMIGLAFTWRSQGKLQDALTLMKQCSELRNKVFGPSHPLSRSSSHTVNEWMDEYNALKDQIPGKGPQTRPEVSEGSSAAVITTPSTYEGHVHLPYPQRRSAATLFLRNHPLMIAARTPLPSSPEGQNLQDVD